MAFCDKCGKALVDGVAFCTACGNPVGPPPTPSVGAQAGGQPGVKPGAQSGVQPAPGGRDPAPPPDLRAGPYDDPDRYELQQMCSRGGEGELWRAAISVDGVRLPVAVKVINETNIDHLDDWSHRWKQQAEILKTLDHPSLVKVRDTFEGPLPHAAGAVDPASRSLFLVMNWVNGESLVEWAAHHPDRDVLDSVRIIARIATAVDYLHSGSSTGKSVLHRDIKPANVLVDGNNVCLVDFGFARLMSGEPMTLAGTPFYLAPEVVGGGTFNEASDRYALGATAYYTIVGEPPIPGDFATMRTKLEHARGVDGRTDLADHVLAMMDPSPAQRPTNSLEWAQSLAAGAVSSSLPTRPVVAAGAAAAAPAATPPAKRKSRTKLIAAVLVVVVVAAAGAAVALALDHGKSNANTPSAALSPNSTPAASSSPTDSESPAVSDSGSPQAADSGAPQTSDGSGTTMMNLSQYAQPITGSVNTGQATVKNDPYPFSVMMEPDYDYHVQYVEYNVPSGFSSFQAAIGLDDSSGSSATTTFQITNAISGQYLFGSASHPITLKVNQVRNINVAFPSDILRIRLTTISNASDSDWDVGVTPVWGNAQFSGPSDQVVLPEPSPSY